MYIKNIKLVKINKRYILGVLMLAIISIIALLIKNSNAVRIKALSIDDKSTLNIKSYYAKTDVTVTSNKNTNTYIIEEWYKENIGNKFNIQDSIGGVTTYLLRGNNLVIKNNKQNSILEILEYNNEEMNILSLNTFIRLYNENISYVKNNISIKEIDNFRYISLPYNKNIYTKTLEIKVDKSLNKILSMTMKDSENRERIVIIYNELVLNNEINNNMFI